MAEVKRPEGFDEWFDPRADSYQYGAEGPALDAWNEQQKKITALERRLRIVERAFEQAITYLNVDTRTGYSAELMLSDISTEIGSEHSEQKEQEERGKR